MFYVYLDTIKFIDPTKSFNKIEEEPTNKVEPKQKKTIIKTYNKEKITDNKDGGKSTKNKGNNSNVNTSTTKYKSRIKRK